MKKVLHFLACFLPWFVSGIVFRFDSEYYEMLNIPGFALPPKVISLGVYLYFDSYKYLYGFT